MASYQDKLNQRLMETESGKIAWCIRFIESGVPGMYFKEDYYEDLRDGEIKLFDDISLRQSSDCLIYEIYRPVEFKANRYLCKYVQQRMSYEWYVTMLDAQPWQYI